MTGHRHSPFVALIGTSAVMMGPMMVSWTWNSDPTYDLYRLLEAEAIWLAGNVVTFVTAIAMTETRRETLAGSTKNHLTGCSYQAGG
jgi:hypothetical protein